MSAAHPVDNAAAHRFEVEVDGQLAVAEYERDGDAIVFTHTFVPEDLRGRGIATALVGAAIDAARRDHLKVVPQCPMVASWMKAHPASHDLLSDDGRAAMDAGAR